MCVTAGGWTAFGVSGQLIVVHPRNLCLHKTVEALCSTFSDWTTVRRCQLNVMRPPVRRLCNSNELSPALHDASTGWIAAKRC